MLQFKKIFFSNVYFFESEFRKQGRGRERGRPRIQSRLHPGSELSAHSLMRDSNP